MTTWVRTPIACLVLVLTMTSSAVASGKAPKLYDSSRDPQKDLLAAEAQAKAEHKYVLLDVGGDWCPGCVALSNWFDSEPRIHELMAHNFVVVRVAVGLFNSQKKFLKQFPRGNVYPHLVVLHADGSVLRDVPDDALFGAKKEKLTGDEQQQHVFEYFKSVSPSSLQ